MAQRGVSDATAWRQRGIYNPTSVFTAGLARADKVAQRGTLQKCAIIFTERGDQKRGTTARPKRDTMTGAFGRWDGAHVLPPHGAYVAQAKLSPSADGKLHAYVNSTKNK